MASVLYSFRESSLFTRDVYRYLTEDDYLALQQFLPEYPAEGDLIRGSGGLRKLRWRAPGRGKTRRHTGNLLLGGREGYIFLLDIYPKSEQEDLTTQEIKQLRGIVQEWLHE